ncbi:MAG TPA: carbonic anhydrase family protein [Steroidobacteraceae bacterium]|jgi:carbonic anhydrase
MRARSLVVLLIAAAGAAPMGSQAQSPDYSRYVSPWKTAWDYQGPRGAAHWSSLDPAYAICNTGREQSPIDIRNPRRADLPALRFVYKSEPAGYVINNRYTLRVNYHDAPGTGGFLMFGKKRYQLVQFHFHHPGEEAVDGKRYPMVLHLMHKSDDGRVVGVAVFLKTGRASATLQRVLDHGPPTEGQLAVPGLMIDPAAMLPRDKSYYMYMGSVSAPPCTEGVRWIVLKTPVEVSAAQVAAFARLFPDDARPLQSLNGRLVEESK